MRERKAPRSLAHCEMFFVIFDTDSGFLRLLLRDDSASRSADDDASYNLGEPQESFEYFRRAIPDSTEDYCSRIVDTAVSFRAALVFPKLEAVESYYPDDPDRWYPVTNLLGRSDFVDNERFDIL